MGKSLAVLIVVTVLLLPLSVTTAQEKNITPVMSLLLSRGIKFGGLTYYEVTSPTGRVWLDRNLGASQVATSSTDSEAYGYLYQWGRLSDGHQDRSSSTNPNLSTTDVPGHGDFITTSSLPLDWRTPQNDSLWQGVSGTNNPCPCGFRLPTHTELINERDSWNSLNSAGAFASPLKLVVTGSRNSLGNLANVDNIGYYWSSTVSSNYGQLQ